MPRAKRADRMTSLVGAARPAQKAVDPWEFVSKVGSLHCVFNGRVVAHITYRSARRDWLLVYPPEEWVAPSRAALEGLCRAIHPRLVTAARQVQSVRESAGWRGWLVRKLTGGRL